MEKLVYGYPLLISITIAYAIVGIDLARIGYYPYALVFSAYALANVGLIWGMK